MPTPFQEQCKTMYERLELSVEEIAKQTDTTVVDVKQALEKCSFKWNRAVKEGGEEDITDAEFAVIKEQYKELAMSAEDESVRARCLGNLWKLRVDERKRAEARKKLGMPNALAEALLRARAARQAREEVIIDVEEHHD